MVPLHCPVLSRRGGQPRHSVCSKEGSCVDAE